MCMPKKRNSRRCSSGILSYMSGTCRSFPNPPAEEAPRDARLPHGPLPRGLHGCSCENSDARHRSGVESIVETSQVPLRPLLCNAFGASPEHAIECKMYFSSVFSPILTGRTTRYGGDQENRHVTGKINIFHTALNKITLFVYGGQNCH